MGKPASASDLHRRHFIAGTAALGSLLAAPGLSPRAARAQQPAPAASVAAQTPLTAKDVYAQARQALFPLCRVCPQCDGVACAGEYPGFGGIGSGLSFQNNFRALQRVELKLRPLNGVASVDKKPDTSTVIFGKTLSLPALAAPIGGVGTNFQNRIDDAAYCEAIIAGCVDAGTMGSIGDGPMDPIEMVKARYDVIARHQGRAVAGIKPRPQANFMSIIRLAEAAGAFMITIDIDSAGRYQGNRPEVMVGPKTVAELAQLVQATKIPFVVKGIMTPEDAVMAGESGAAGIVVSNHGGRVLDDTPGTAEVLPAIADKVKGKMVIFVDGCVRYGHDVLKYVALGADAVLVGRHLVRAAFGGGRPGVALFMRMMRDELEAAMVLTGVADIRSVGRTILA